MITLATIACFVLLLLAFLHVYWAFGGLKGISVVIPQDEQNQQLFEPGKWATLFVAVCLFISSLILGIEIGIIPFLQESRFVSILCFICFFVLCVRSIGDFKYVGLFKRRSCTTFSKMDTAIYTPLCLWLSFIFLYALIS
ncbi:DUF3995 domain-containing protein [Bacillus solimangrovi]|uniref:DUF3995 domain-containing protein n=1 Tax=Bacillus solimangrovi TaxID=1305675 RepID=A0A1E5LKE3_9BACI|nr:DUF3995 domain-containing protein [Bacillus solimangrovi]OEH94541.1 hypothetical protein BFG57_07680 [Bacillus solimangrovi]